MLLTSERVFINTGFVSILFVSNFRGLSVTFRLWFWSLFLQGLFQQKKPAFYIAVEYRKSKVSEQVRRAAFRLLG